MRHGTDLRPGPRVPLSPDHDDQVRARHHASPAAVAGQSRTRSCPSIHIGGTNGKGSVCTLVAAALREAGWRVGLYTSPHLVSFRERIRVDGVPITEEAVAMWTERLQPLILERRATFFEATTAIAFADFAARGAEIAVVEVGLGGRLDSTNVVTPAGERGDQDRARSHEVPGRHAGEDRRREGGHRQAGRAVRRSASATRAGGGAPPRGPAGGGARRRPARAPTCGSCRRSTNGAVRSASRGRTSAATPAVAHGVLMALPPP